MTKKVDYMSKAEFSRALDLLQQLRDTDKLDLLGYMQGEHGWDKFAGLYIDSNVKPLCTLSELAHMIGYQCIQLNGDLDSNELDQIWSCRHRILIIGPGSDEVIAGDLASTEREKNRLAALDMIDRSLAQVS